MINIKIKNTERISVSRIIKLILWIILFFGALVHIVLSLNEGYGALNKSYETSKPESFVLHGVRNVGTGAPLYPEFGQGQYWIHAYNPLTYLPAGLITRLFKLSVQQSLIAGRIISYVSMICLALMLFCWFWINMPSKYSAIFILMCILYYHSIVSHDFFRLRPESPGLLFTYAGIITFLSKRRWRIYVSAVLFVIAYLFKQPFIAAPVAIFVFLFISKKYSEMFIFALTYWVCVLTFLLLMFALTGKGFFQHTIISMAVNEVDSGLYCSRYLIYLKMSFLGPLLTLPLAFIGIRNNKNTLFLFIYFLVCLAWTYYSSAKIGASVNYFGEIAVLILIIIAFSISLMEYNKNIQLPVTIIFFFSFIFILHYYGIIGFPTTSTIHNGDISGYLKKYHTVKGKKLIMHDSIAARFGGDDILFDWLLMDILYTEGLIDFTGFAKKISSGEYGLIVIDSNRAYNKLEDLIIETINKGPYQLIYADEFIKEYKKDIHNGF